jgi:hypothetical protein
MFKKIIVFLLLTSLVASLSFAAPAPSKSQPKQETKQQTATWWEWLWPKALTVVAIKTFHGLFFDGAAPDAAPADNDNGDDGDGGDDPGNDPRDAQPRALQRGQAHPMLGFLALLGELDRMNPRDGGGGNGCAQRGPLMRGRNVLLPGPGFMQQRGGMEPLALEMPQPQLRQNQRGQAVRVTFIEQFMMVRGNGTMLLGMIARSFVIPMPQAQAPQQQLVLARAPRELPAPSWGPTTSSGHLYFGRSRFPVIERAAQHFAGR